MTQEAPPAPAKGSFRISSIRGQARVRELLMGWLSDERQLPVRTHDGPRLMVLTADPRGFASPKSSSFAPL